jgi:ParB/RepB/Spo0J family partition protein
MKIIDAKISDIKIQEGRYRKDFGDIESLANSIAAVGQFIPIIITEDMKLIAGERRMKAMQLLKRDTIKATVLSANEVDQKIIEISENLERKDFTWQEKVLATEELHNLFKATYPQWSERKTAQKAGLSTGGVVTDLNLAEALKQDPELFSKCKTRESALKVLQRFKLDEAITELHLRRTKTDYGRKASQFVFQGNCCELVQRIPNQTLNGIISDPFYGIDIENKKKEDSVLDQKIYEDDINLYKNTMATFLENVKLRLKLDAYIVLFCAVQHFYWLRDEVMKLGFTCDWCPGIWYRVGHPGQTNQPNLYFGRSYETFLYGLRGNATIQKPGLGNVLPFAQVNPLDKTHPLQKPFSLMEELIVRFCLPGHIILDPFCGAGTTLLAAIKRGITPIGIELDPIYYKVAVENVSKALKLKDGGMADNIGISV